MKTLVGLALQQDSSALLLAIEGLAKETASSVDQVNRALEEIQTQSFDTERLDIIAWPPLHFIWPSEGGCYFRQWSDNQP